MLLNVMLGIIITLAAVNIILCLISGAFLEAVLSLISVYPACWTYGLLYGMIAAVTSSFFGTVLGIFVVGIWAVCSLILSYTVHPATRGIYLLISLVLALGFFGAM